MKAFRAENTSGQEGGSTILDRLMSAVEASFDSLKGAVLNDTLVRATLGTGDTVVTHGLGYVPRTWEIVDRDANANVWRSPTVNQRASSTIILRASAAVTVLLRFS